MSIPYARARFPLSGWTRAVPLWQGAVTLLGSLGAGGARVSGEDSIGSGRRYRAYQIGGLVVGALFLGLGAAALFAGGGPIIAAIAGIGGLAVLIVSIVMLVRS